MEITGVFRLSLPCRLGLYKGPYPSVTYVPTGNEAALMAVSSTQRIEVDLQIVPGDAA